MRGGSRITDQECAQCGGLLFFDVEYQPAEYDVGIYAGYSVQRLGLEFVDKELPDYDKEAACRCQHDPADVAKWERAIEEDYNRNGPYEPDF